VSSLPSDIISSSSLSSSPSSSSVASLPTSSYNIDIASDSDNTISNSTNATNITNDPTVIITSDPTNIITIAESTIIDQSNSTIVDTSSTDFIFEDNSIYRKYVVALPDFDSNNNNDNDDDDDDDNDDNRIDFNRSNDRSSNLQQQQQRQSQQVQSQSQLQLQRQEQDDLHESITLLVDGINYPITSGSFIELCLKGYYNNERVSYQSYEDFGLPTITSTTTTSSFITTTSSVTNNGYSDSSSSSSFNSITNRNITILGNILKDYIDPLTMNTRRIPLEIFREDKNRLRYTVIGAAKNSIVYTKATPLQSFATYGAIGMYHPKMDINGGSSNAIFWCPFNHT